LNSASANLSCFTRNKSAFAMHISLRRLSQYLLCAFLWISQNSTATDIVSSASKPSDPLPPVSSGQTETLRLGDTLINLFIEDRSFDVGPDGLRDWVLRSAEIVSQYYGSFPVDEVHIAIRGRRGNRVVYGQAFGGAGAVVNVDVGLATTRESLEEDWILIHELIHLAFPTVPRRHHWIEEGLSVYVESIARANAGALTADTVWLGFLRGMPNGLPKSGDKGLDYTPTWGRTYWGGALFCLMADIRIRQQTDNEKNLRDALRAIVAAGYDMTTSGDMRAVLELGDQATGVTVLTELYDEMRAAPYPDELDGLWIALGVTEQTGSIVYDDTAALAKIRRALTEEKRPAEAGLQIMPGY
jgi:hypothetical protein